MGNLALFSNPYAIPVVLVNLGIHGLGVFVLARERGTLTGWLFFAMATTVGLYLGSAGFSYAATDPQTSLSWARIAHVGVAFMPAAILWSTTSILGRVRERLARLIFASAVSMTFAVLVLATNLFVSGNVPVYWGYYPTYGVAGPFFIGYFVTVMVYILVRYAVERARATNDDRRKRLSAMIVAFAAGYVGAVDFLPAFGVELYAFGYIPIFVFILIVAFVVLRYRLVDITPSVAAPEILKTMQSGVLVTDREGIVRVANDTASSILQIPVKNLEGMPLSEVIDSHDQLGGSDTSLRIVDHEMDLPNSQRRTVVSIHASPLSDRPGKVLGRVFVVHDITSRKDAEAELRRLALFDTLTGLPNRVLFFDRLKQLLELARRNSFTLAILYMDLDRFKEVNDTYGHEAGDELLRQVAERMRSVTRGADTVARMGGDEFIGVCGRITEASDAEIVARKLVDRIEAPFDVSGVSISIGVSIGISVYPDHSTDAETLLALADRTMYDVKESRGSGFRVYSPAEISSPKPLGNRDNLGLVDHEDEDREQRGDSGN
jgi:diguanylate cyclase (GGDEF)-like protein/PAS domain S-box-containing protein